MRALSDELGGDAGRIAERLGLDREGLEEAAWGRSEALFHTVTDPHQFPGPRSAGAVAGALLHGALCGAAAHTQARAPQPERLATAADIFEAVRSYGAQYIEMGDSQAALARYGMLRARDLPAFAELAPPGAVAGVSIETGMTDAVARDVLGLDRARRNGRRAQRARSPRARPDRTRPGDHFRARDLTAASQRARADDDAATDGAAGRRPRRPGLSASMKRSGAVSVRRTGDSRRGDARWRAHARRGQGSRSGPLPRSGLDASVA